GRVIDEGRPLRRRELGGRDADRGHRAAVGHPRRRRRAVDRGRQCDDPAPGLMMRAILLVLAACGRIGFGAGGGGGGNGDGATGDGPDANDIVVSLAAAGDCPSIAWNGSQLGIAWRDVDAVWFAIVDANAATVRTPAPIVLGLSNLGCPTLAWTGTTFVVAYSSGALGKG